MSGVPAGSSTENSFPGSPSISPQQPPGTTPVSQAAPASYSQMFSGGSGGSKGSGTPVAPVIPSSFTPVAAQQAPTTGTVPSVTPTATIPYSPFSGSGGD